MPRNPCYLHRESILRKIHFTFSCGTVLPYVLHDTRTTAGWCKQFSQVNPRMLVRHDVNHRHGFASPEEISAAIRRLKRATDFLGFAMQPLERSNWHDTLNDLHLNFPGFFATPHTEQGFHAAHEMNLLIHWLEYELSNAIEGKGQYIYNLDFNHLPEIYNQKEFFPDDEFGHFSTDLEFGSLHLHYIYIGRHFLEMFDARDLVAPPNHFRAQHEYNATCGLSFSEPCDSVSLNQAMQQYYDDRGGQTYFGFAYQDPKLAKGFFRLGRLENIDTYRDPAMRASLRDQLKNSVVVAWRLE
jgi:hypothetical protein